MALTGDRNTAERSGVDLSLPVAAATKIWAGALVVLAAGYAKGGVNGVGLIAVGRAEEQVDNNAGADGELTVRVKRGVFRYANSGGGDAIAAAQIGSVCYIVDDQTVAKTSDTGARSRAGRVVDVDAQGVWVEVGRGPFDSDADALLGANNLDDVASPATARANIGANLIPLAVPDAAALDAVAPIRIVSPVAGTLSKIWSVIDGALTTGNATLTAAINGTPVTNGVVTITEAGSAAGDVDSATPSAANAVAVGDVITLTPGGTNDAARTAAVTLLIET
jgi:hypothetical protein